MRLINVCARKPSEIAKYFALLGDFPAATSNGPLLCESQTNVSSIMSLLYVVHCLDVWWCNLESTSLSYRVFCGVFKDPFNNRVDPSTVQIKTR